MININTINPGDNIVFHVHSGSRCFADDGISSHEIFDGDIFVVSDPPLDERKRNIRLACNFFTCGFFLSAPDHGSLVDTEDQ